MGIEALQAEFAETAYPLMSLITIFGVMFLFFFAIARDKTGAKVLLVCLVVGWLGAYLLGWVFTAILVGLFLVLIALAMLGIVVWAFFG